MFNFSLKYGVSEFAEVLKVNIATIKKWVLIFSDYLSPKANQGKGKVHPFF
jgi:hypothetical protein